MEVVLEDVIKKRLFASTFPIVNLLFEFNEEDWFAILKERNPQWNVSIVGAFVFEGPFREHFGVVAHFTDRFFVRERGITI